MIKALPYPLVREARVWVQTVSPKSSHCYVKYYLIGACYVPAHKAVDEQDIHGF